MQTIIKRYSVALVKESAHKYEDIPEHLINPEKVVKYADSVLNFGGLTKENFVLVPKEVPNRVELYTFTNPYDDSSYTKVAEWAI